MTGFSDEVSVAIIGAIATVVSALITAVFAYLTNPPKEDGKKNDAEAEATFQITMKKRVSVPFEKQRREWRGFRVDYLWIPIICAACVIVTLIAMLAVQHEARQNVRKILYDSPDFHMNMGDQYAAMGDFASAELEYYQAIEDDDSDAFAHDKRAVALAKDGRLEEALEENMTACALAPDVAQYHNNKGVTLYEIGVRKSKEGNKKAGKQYIKNAVEACKTAVELDSTIAEYHYNLSRALLFTYDVDGAMLECSIALQLNSEKSEYHCLYSTVLFCKGQYENALNESRKAIEIDPDNAYAYYILTTPLEKLNQFDEAVSAYRQAIQLNPDVGAYHDYLGEILYNLGRYREALKEFETEIPLQEPYPYQQSISYYNAAYVLVRLNRYDEALQYVEKGIDAYWDYPENHYLRYALLTYFNRHEEAAQELQTAYDFAGIPLPEEADASI